MKKKLLSFIFAICLIVPCMFLLTACGDKEVIKVELCDVDNTYKDVIGLSYDYGEIDGEEIMLRAYTARATYSDGKVENLIREDTTAEDLVGASISCSKLVGGEYVETSWLHGTLEVGTYKVEVSYYNKKALMVIIVNALEDDRGLSPQLTIKNIYTNTLQYGETFSDDDVRVSLTSQSVSLTDCIEMVHFITAEQYNTLNNSTSDAKKLNNYDYVMSVIGSDFKTVDHLSTMDAGTYYMFFRTTDNGHYKAGMSRIVQYKINPTRISLYNTLRVNIKYNFNFQSGVPVPVTKIAGTDQNALGISWTNSQENAPYYMLNNELVYEDNFSNYGWWEFYNEDEVLDYNDNGKNVRLKFVPYSSNYVSDSTVSAKATIIRQRVDTPYLLQNYNFVVRTVKDWETGGYSRVNQTISINGEEFGEKYNLDASSDSTTNANVGVYYRKYSLIDSLNCCWSYEGGEVDENTEFLSENMIYDAVNNKMIIRWEIQKIDLTDGWYIVNTCRIENVSNDGYSMNIEFDPSIASNLYVPASTDEVSITVKLADEDVTSAVISGVEINNEDRISWTANFSSKGAGEYDIIFTISNNPYIKDAVLTFDLTIPQQS